MGRQERPPVLAGAEADTLFEPWEMGLGGAFSVRLRLPVC